MNKPPLKGYQKDGLSSVRAELKKDPTKPILVVGPCGSGKSRLMEEMCEWALASSRRSGVVTHRQMLTDQLAEDFVRSDIPHSIFASGYDYDEVQPVQIVSAPTLFRRCFQKGAEDIPALDIVQIDEAHQQTGKQAQALIYGGVVNNCLMNGYTFRGGSVVGYTATPVIRKGLYAKMLQIANYSDMRAEGMHQLVKVFSPDEIDVSNLRSSADSGNYSEKQLEKRIQGNMTIFASVINEYRRLNPAMLPAILFAPSVASSMWFASCMCNEGIPAAHLCGKYIGWPVMSNSIGNRLQYTASDRDSRKELMEAHKAGEIKVITNRFVLREAVNMPWCYHAIFATVMGGLSTYLQAVGRLQRYWPDYEYKILQCHGGHYWRHGSPNEDRFWKIGDTNASLGYARMEACAKGKKPEGVRCPRCGAWRMGGPVCLSCGHAHTESYRAIRQLSGRLKIQEGRVFTKAPPTKVEKEAAKLWRKALWSCFYKNLPVSAACGMLAEKAAKAGVVVDWRSLPMAPPDPDTQDYHRRVGDVYPWFKRGEL